MSAGSHLQVHNRVGSAVHNGQSTFILPVDGQYIFMADIWRPRHPRDARYIWLPIEFEQGKPVVRWRDEWQPTLSSAAGK